MNGKQRIEAALRGEQPDRTPVMLHNFLMAAREAGLTQRQYREDPQAIATAFIRAVETYDYDGVVVDAAFSGQDGSLRCPAPLADPASAVAAAESVWGVRTIEIDASCGVTGGADAPTTLPTTVPTSA